MNYSQSFDSSTNLKPAMSRSLDSEFSINGIGLTSDPAPQRRRSPSPAKEEPRTLVGARSAWGNRPGGRAMNRNAARSRSPIPEDRQAPISRSRTPSNSSSSSSSSSGPRYRYIPREYHSPPKLTLAIPQNNRPAPQVRPLPPSRNAQDSPRGRSYSDEIRPAAGLVSQQTSQLLPQNRPRGQSIALAPLPSQPLHLRGQAQRQPRKHVPSMVDYLSLEQLESLWQSQDKYLGTIVEPQHPTSPISIIAEDPSSPCLGVHPAFRNDPENDPNYKNLICV